MEKRVLFFISVLLLVNLVFVAYAQDDVDPDSGADALKDVGETTGVSGLGDKTNAALAKEVEITPGLQLIARILFGIKEKLSLDYFIVLICVFIGFIVLLQSVLRFVPLFDGWKSWAGGIIITWIMGISGGFFWIIGLLFSFANIFGILEKWSILRVVVVILLVVFFIVGFVIIAQYFKKKAALSEAEDSGHNAGVGARMMQIVAESTKNN